MKKALLALAAILLIVPATASAQNCSTTANQWQCWEGTIPITTSCPNLNLYRDIKVKVNFTQGSTTRQTYAFWNGNNTQLKMRMNFPTSGSWSWSSTCQETCTGGGCVAKCPCVGGTNLSGQTVSVGAPAASGPAIYTHGPIQVVNNVPNNNNRYFVHADGFNFFWMGDTAWRALVRATTTGINDWNTYLANRAGKKFSVIQVGLPEDWMDGVNGVQPTDANGNIPFDQVAGCSSSDPLPNKCSQWRAAFWNEVDKKIKAANDQGFVVVVVGLMEGPIQNNAAGKFCPPLQPDSEIYARNVASRLAGYDVIVSPGFDRYNGTSQCSFTTPPVITDRIRAIGQEIDRSVPHLLVTNHWASYASLADMQAIHNTSDTWLDFDMFQSGQAGKEATEAAQLQLLLRRAWELPLNLRATTPDKPNVNGESIYDGETGPFGTGLYTDYRERQTAYFSWLSGAVGFSYGVAGVHDWSNITTGMARASNNQMTHLTTLFRDNLNWPLLRPAHGLVANNPGTVTEDKRMLSAQTIGGGTVVAYLPDRSNREIQLNLASLPALQGQPGRWYDPRNGVFVTNTYTQGTPISVGSTTYRYCTPCQITGQPNPACGAPLTTPPVCPTNGDWVLVVP
jgi:hypothetical protein